MREHFLTVLKFILAILLIPITIFITIHFSKSLSALPLEARQAFVLGILIYTIIHLFIHEPLGIFQFGQKIVSGIFGFSAPLAAFSSVNLPFFSLFILMVFYVLTLLKKIGPYGSYLMFFAGCAWAFHIIFMAKQLREQTEGVARATYILSAQLIFIFNCSLMAAIFVLLFHKFPFVLFFQDTFYSARDFYVSVFRQLFVP